MQSKIAGQLIRCSSILIAGSLFADEHHWNSTQLESQYFSEGASFGDIDGDGHGDLVSGPFWYRGPEFHDRFAYYSQQPTTADEFCENFFSYIHDFNGDKRNDILVLGFPGKEARLYTNPGQPHQRGNWSVHIVADPVSHEAPTLVDLIPGGAPELVCSRGTRYGFYHAGNNAVEPWEWTAISEPSVTAEVFGHGLGVGDINGDGRLDVIDRMSWWEQPEDGNEGLWQQHQWTKTPFPGGAQILVNDVDGDGDSDLITSLSAHGYGIAWFEQSDRQFVRHDIVGSSSIENPYGVVFSQPHGLALADIDQDGIMDFVTGKRWKGHNGSDPGAHQAPVVYWFRCQRSDQGIDWVPHKISSVSGIGMSVTIADLEADGRPDIITANKLGLTIHRQPPVDAQKPESKWRITGSRAQDSYQSGLEPSAAQSIMTAPGGFHVDLVSSEPTIAQPIAMCFDARGRIWLLEGHTYPNRAPEGQGKDRVVILEDSDHNGSFESSKVFVEGINLGSGIEVGFGGVWIGAAPYLLFYPDADQDDQPDAQPTILLDGWGYQDTHETLNSFTWGPDGWLYGCHGVFTHSRVGRPGSNDAERTPLNAGIWRYHPVRHQFEVFAHGTSNPWGVDYNAQGDFFISACVIPHFFHMVQGGRYIRQGGRHFNPHTFGEIDTIADHAHYVGAIQEHAFWGPNKTKRPPAPLDISILGGGHAHSGLAIYQSNEFPIEFRNQAYFHNLHGHRMVREYLEPDGSSYTARHRPDFVFANNHDFIGVSVMQGPDGALYFSDWVDPQTCHHRDDGIWDRTNGRIYRIRYGDSKGSSINYRQETTAALTQHLASPNGFLARQAQLVLQERSARNQLDKDQLKSALLKRVTDPNHSKTVRLRAWWTAHSCSLLTEADWIERLRDADEHVRSWTIQFIGEANQPLSSTLLTRLEQLARKDRSLVTHRYLASLLQRLPLEQRLTLAHPLLENRESRYDRNIPYLIWYGIEPLVEAHGKTITNWVREADWQQLVAYTARRTFASPEGRSRLLKDLGQAASASSYLELSQQLLTALANLPSVERPPGWRSAKQRGEQLAVDEASISNVLRRLGVRFGDADYFPYWRQVVQSRRRPAERIEALNLLQSAADPEIGRIARPLLSLPRLREAAIRALRQAPSLETARALIQHLQSFSQSEKNIAVNLLASHPTMALELLDSVEQDRLPSAVISPLLLSQLDRLNNTEINEHIERNWVRATKQVHRGDLQQSIREWNRKLNPTVLQNASAGRGRTVYNQICGNCHPLFGEGVALGPDLTGSNRVNLNYLLENVLAPSAIVGRDYLVTTLELRDGSIVSGLLQEESPSFLSLKLPGGTSTEIKVADVVHRERTDLSIMPSGLFDAMPLEQVADLVKYLASPVQVSEPEE